uniref:Ig-like domain-containing protein n=1 Tax=Nothobranchius furzeri TaxID=105023 RepID=A0A8C6VVW2_NOTFU
MLNLLYSLIQTVAEFPNFKIWTDVTKSAEMNCSHNRDKSYNQMYWYRQRPGETMTLIVFTVFGGKPDYGQSSQSKYSAVKDSIETAVFSTDQVHWDSGVNEAYFGAGTRLTVLGRSPTTPTVEVFKPSAKECNDPNKKRKKTLVCVASGFYPDHVSVSWMLNGVQTGKGVATDSTAKRDGDSYRITSRLKVQAKDWFRPGNRFTCTVKYSFSDLPTEKYLRITQNAKLFYVVLIVKSCIYGAFVCFLVWKLQVCQQPPYELNFQAAKMSL